MIAKKKISKQRKMVMTGVLVVMLLGTFIIAYNSFFKKSTSQNFYPNAEDLAEQEYFIPEPDDSLSSVPALAEPSAKEVASTKKSELQLFGYSSFNYINPPEIFFISPNQSSLSGGALIVINGSYFGDEQGNGFVKFKNENVASITSWSDTKIEVQNPPLSPGAVAITVQAANGLSDTEEAAFNYVDLPLPVISSISPSSVSTQKTVTVVITGSNFGSKKLSGLVNFGKAEAASYLSWSDTKIEVTAPQNPAGLVDVFVKNSSELIGIKRDSFNYIDFNPPVISNISPKQGSVEGGATLTIIGENFGAEQGEGFVTFNGIAAAEYKNWSSSEIIVVVPSHVQGTVEVKVRADSGLASSESQVAATFKDLKTYITLPIKIDSEKIGNPLPFFVPEEESKEEESE